MKPESIFSPHNPALNWMAASQLAQVVSLDDPDNAGRVKIKLLAFSGAPQQAFELWARVVSAFAGSDRGAFFLPDVDDEVLVVFAQGDPRYPLIVGGLWNGAASAPAQTQAGGVNRYKRIKSKNGVTISFDDQSGQETLTLETPGGQVVTLKDGPATVTVEDASGNSVKLEASGITIQATAKVSVSAPQVEVSAGMVTVDTALAKFSGIVKCEVLQTTSVISSSYTPGAGNVW